MENETEFAKGDNLENQSIRVAYESLNSMEPGKKFPRVYKDHGDGSVTCLSLTPAEGKFLKKVLNSMFPE